MDNTVFVSLILPLKINILYLFLMIKQKKDDILIEYIMEFINTSKHFFAYIYTS
jgi:hypothetical protein